MATEHRSAGSAECTFDPEDGCRLTSLRVRDHELLWLEGRPPWPGGSFVMAPFAGRVRDGLATWQGHQREFPTGDDGNALHGLVLARPWSRIDDDTWEVQVDEHEWFGRCTIRQSIRLTEDALHLDLEVAADTPVPATVGWHPWFRRQIAGAHLDLQVQADGIRTKDEAGITTADVTEVPPGPWDDSFIGVTWPVRLSWPGVVDLQITSDAPLAVVYTELSTAVCVEPQTGPPNEVNQPNARTADPGSPLKLSTTWSWSTPA